MSVGASGAAVGDDCVGGAGVVGAIVGSVASVRRARNAALLRSWQAGAEESGPPARRWTRRPCCTPRCRSQSGRGCHRYQDTQWEREARAAQRWAVQKPQPAPQMEVTQVHLQGQPALDEQVLPAVTHCAQHESGMHAKPGNS